MDQARTVNPILLISVVVLMIVSACVIKPVIAQPKTAVILRAAYLVRTNEDLIYEN